MPPQPPFWFEIFQTKTRLGIRYYWHLEGKNHEKIAASGGDGFVERSKCLESLRLVKTFAEGAPVKESLSDGGLNIVENGDPASWDQTA
jgi:uncharacterized protein YegP (UPF0339 family)